MAELINRPVYSDQLIQNRDVDLVKIVTVFIWTWSPCFIAIFIVTLLFMTMSANISQRMEESTWFLMLLSGRHVEIRMLPLSFKEFLTFYEFGPSVTAEEKFQRYLQFGGMPILREYRFKQTRECCKKSSLTLATIPLLLACFMDW